MTEHQAGGRLINSGRMKYLPGKMPGEGVKNKEKMKLSKDAVKCITSRLDWRRVKSRKHKTRQT